MYQRCVIIVADGARADLMGQLLSSGELPNIRKHLVTRGCFRTALTVFPSTTGPAHIPFVSGVHPGTADIPGYRWLCRETHDRRRRSIYRHRSLNSPRGLCVGRDMNRTCTSLFEHFPRPASVLELIDYCRNQHLYKIRVRRLLRIVQAHRSDDWSYVDRMVERMIIKRIQHESHCIIGSFFGIDEYSHLYGPHDERTIGAYHFIDRAVGKIVETLKTRGVYDETILAVVSDHGLTKTHTHIPLVDITRDHGFNPYYYPKMYRRSCDAAVLESGNAMAQLYFKRGSTWGAHWRFAEMQESDRICSLSESLVARKGVSFIMARDGNQGVVVTGREGRLLAEWKNEAWEIRTEGTSPLPEHPVGRFAPEELFALTYNHTYPDAVNQAALLFRSRRSGDLLISSEPGYDLRRQYEKPEHHGSHGSLHREHMHVPLAFSLPIAEVKCYNYDIVPTILAACGKPTDAVFDGRVLTISEKTKVTANTQPTQTEKTDGGNSNGALRSILITVGIILTGILIVGLMQSHINAFGTELMQKYGQDKVDIILFLLTAVSSTPLALPIWGYSLVGIALGYSVVRLAIVMAVGSALGSFVTFALGKYFGHHPWVVRKFPGLHRHKWTEGKSRRVVTLLLFLGTASPLPCDVFYVACGAKAYPSTLFLVTMIAARFVRYIYMGYGFLYFGHFLI